MVTKGKKIKTAIIFLISIALMLSPVFILNTKASEDTETTFPGAYTIEYLMSHYNLVTLGDLNGLTHVVGPILVGGDLNAQLYHSQVTNNVSSYIKGKITNGGNVNSTDGTKPTLYLGSSNKVDGSNVNGSWYTNNPIVVTDNYLDFDKLYSNVRSQSKNLPAGQVVTPDENGVITIEEGTANTIETLVGVTSIDVKASVNSTNLTLITIKDSGAVSFPGMLINGGQYNTGESSGAGTAIVWNMPNANSVSFPSMGFTGHLIAPNADVTYPTSNYGGCFIVKTMDGHVEGHYYPYNNGALANAGATEENENTITGGNGTTGGAGIGGGASGEGGNIEINGGNINAGGSSGGASIGGGTSSEGEDISDGNVDSEGNFSVGNEQTETNDKSNSTNTDNNEDAANRNDSEKNSEADAANRENSKDNDEDATSRNNSENDSEADAANRKDKNNNSADAASREDSAVRTGDNLIIMVLMLVAGTILFIYSVKGMIEIRKMKKQ